MHLQMQEMVGTYRRWNWVPRTLFLTFVSILFASSVYAGPALAQTDATEEICNNALMVFVNNIITFIGVIGPAIAFAVFLISLVALSFFAQIDQQKQWKERRNRSLLYGTLMVVAGQIFSLFISLAGGSVASCINLL